MSTGATSDLERATALARRMVTEYGMSERLGVATFGSNDDQSWLGANSRSYSEQTAQVIDAEVRSLIDNAYEHARRVIVEHRAVLDRVANALLQCETLQGDQLERIFCTESPTPGQGWG
jgi:cell division protease FtsH